MIQNKLLLLSFLLASLSSTALAHKGPDPLARWIFDDQGVNGDTLTARRGPDGKLSGRLRMVDDEYGQSLHFSGWAADCVIAKEHREVAKVLPQQAITVSAWVSIDKPQSKGGIIGTLQDNGDEKAGWLLGYDENVFSFTLGTKGSIDTERDRGRLTFLKGKTRYKLGQWYHIAAVYDGKKMELYVNGKLDASSETQSGQITYPSTAPFTIGVYRDRNHNVFHFGRIRSVTLYDIAAKNTWVAEEFQHGRQLVALPAPSKSDDLKFVVKPYLQYGTKDGMTVMWRTSQPGSTIVHYGTDFSCKKSVTVDGIRDMHEVRIEGLQTGTQYFYRVETVTESGEGIYSEGSTFSTAVDESTPYAFAVIGDTQGNPKVSGVISKLAWAQRPSFAIHAGDLVSTGSDPSHWIDHFFASMEPLMSRVATYPVLGNHEDDSPNYYMYMSLPDPEYYYQFSYGNAQFFMLDTNRNVAPGTEQYKWLEAALAESQAKWKFVCHHHPPYSSDENDYGDLWKTNVSDRGSLEARQLSPLYEKYDVDIVWNGHIHSYERTWPVEKDIAKEKNAPFYMITGGGGGNLETPGPFRPFFQNHVRRGHHYVMVHINGGTLELRAYSLDDNLFDHLTIRKD